jgi:hypothetical protein
LRGIRKEFTKNKDFDGNLDYSKFNGAPCAFFDGVHDYFNLNEQAFKAKNPGMHWNGPCAENIRYSIDPAGSMHSYRQLLSLANTDRKIAIILYSGTWDSVVPYTDTLKGIRELNLQEVYT